MSSNLDLYTASDHLPSYLLSSKGHSYQVGETAFQNAIGTDKPRWDWLEEKITKEEATKGGPGYPGMPAMEKLYLDQKDKDVAIPRPELETFGLAMTGGGKVYGTAHLYGKTMHYLQISKLDIADGHARDFKIIPGGT